MTKVWATILFFTLSACAADRSDAKVTDGSLPVSRGFVADGVMQRALPGRTFALVSRETGSASADDIADDALAKLNEGEAEFAAMLTYSGMTEVDGQRQQPDYWLISAVTAEGGQGHHWPCLAMGVWAYWPWAGDLCEDASMKAYVEDMGRVPGSVLVSLFDETSFTLVYGIVAFGPDPDIVGAVSAQRRFIPIESEP